MKNATTTIRRWIAIAVLALVILSVAAWFARRESLPGTIVQGGAVSHEELSIVPPLFPELLLSRPG